jgi:hypothetical protein
MGILQETVFERLKQNTTVVWYEQCNNVQNLQHTYLKQNGCMENTMECFMTDLDSSDENAEKVSRPNSIYISLSLK